MSGAPLFRRLTEMEVSCIDKFSLSHDMEEVLMADYVPRPIVMGGIVSVFWLLTLCSAHAELKVNFESPDSNDIVAGVAVIRGWAYDTVASVHISSIEWFIDDVSQGDIACCTTRADVVAAFPSDTNAENSGFGATTNWGNFSTGAHTIRVEVHTTAGETFVSDTRDITVVKLGGFSFLDQFSAEVDTSFAQVQTDNTVCLENIEIADKDSGATMFVKALFRWQEACQCLTLVSTEEDGYCDF